jgi:proteic killer suppression protein
MIRSFRGQLAEDQFFDRHTAVTRHVSVELRVAAQRKLQYLNVAVRLGDLRVPPGNRLEALRGGLAGFHTVRINAQWRVAFRWHDGAHDVRIVDYH